MINAIHLSAFIEETSKVWNFTTICEGVIIGRNSVIGSNCYIGKNCVIGHNVHIQHGVFLPNNTIVEDNVFIGPNATFTDDRYPRSGNTSYEAKPPILRNGCSIGAGVVVLPGIEIGACAMVGAGAVVTKNVTPGETVFGLPAIGRDAQ